MKQHQVGTHVIGDSLDDLEHYLNERARRGWRLVAFVPGGFERVLVFERDIDEADTPEPILSPDTIVMKGNARND